MSLEDIHEKVNKLVPTASGAIGGAVGAFLGGPIGGAVGGAIPGLMQTLADIPVAKRHKERIDNALKELEVKLQPKIELLNAMNDNQYKIINEALSTISKTIESEKIEYLKKIIISSVEYSDYGDYESILISRIIRDITSEEIKFLIENFSYTSIEIYSWYKENDNSKENQKKLSDLRKKITKSGGVLILPNSQEAFVINGLANLGVFAPAELSLGFHVYKFSPISVKLIALLTK